MGFIDELKSFAAKTAKGAVKVSNDVVDYTKYQLKIAEIKDKIDDKYKTIGQLVVAKTNDGYGDTADIDVLVEEVNILKAELAEKQEELAKLKKSKQCPECDKMSSTSSNYCSNCGNKIFDTQE